MMPASGNPNLSADTSRTTPYHLLLSLCCSTAFQSCYGYSGSVPYCWRIHVNNSCRVTPSLPRCFMCGFVQQPVAQSFASDTSPHCIDIRNHRARHRSLPADQSSPGQISFWLPVFSYHRQPLQTVFLPSRTDLSPEF